MSSLDDDAAIDIELRRLGQVDIGPNADGQHHQVGGNEAAIGELHAFGPFGAGDFLGLAVREEGDAAPVQVALQHLAGRRIELAFHQGGHQVHQRHRHAALLQSPGRFQPQQAAADHHRALVDLAAASILSTSAMSRKAQTPGRPRPGMGGARGREPVAINSRS